MREKEWEREGGPKNDDRNDGLERFLKGGMVFFGGRKLGNEEEGPWGLERDGDFLKKKIKE